MVPAAAVALGAAGARLVVACWRRGSVLAALCAVLGVVSAALAGTAGWAQSSASDALAGSLAAIVIGTVLLVLGQAIGRLLDENP